MRGACMCGMARTVGSRVQLPCSSQEIDRQSAAPVRRSSMCMPHSLSKALYRGLLAGVSLACVVGCAAPGASEGWPELVVPSDKMELSGSLRIQVPRRNLADSMPSGTAILRVHIGEDGRVRKTSIAETSGTTALDAAAARSLADARFVPYSIDGAAVPVTILLPVYFKGSTQCVGTRPLDCS